MRFKPQPIARDVETIIHFDNIDFAELGIRLSGSVAAAIERDSRGVFKEVIGIGEIVVARMTYIPSGLPVIASERSSLLQKLRGPVMANNNQLKLIAALWLASRVCVPVQGLS